LIPCSPFDPGSPGALYKPFSPLVSGKPFSIDDPVRPVSL
jgi:hypothetical protein